MHMCLTQTLINAHRSEIETPCEKLYCTSDTIIAKYRLIKYNMNYQSFFVHDLVVFLTLFVVQWCCERSILL